MSWCGFLPLGRHECGIWVEVFGLVWRRAVGLSPDSPRSTPADKERPLGTPVCPTIEPSVEDGALGFVAARRVLSQVMGEEVGE